MTVIRHYSMMNDFIDFAIIVKDEDVPAASAAVLKGMDEFWDGNCEPYGSCVEYALFEAGIIYAIAYIPTDRYGDVIDEEEWEAWCTFLAETMNYQTI